VTVKPLLPLALGGLYPLHALGTVVAVFRPVRLRHIVAAADGTGLHAVTVEQGGTQANIQRQDCNTEPATYKGVCDTLDADTLLAIIQE